MALRPKAKEVSVAGVIAVVAMVLLAVLIHFSAYLRGPGTHDLMPEQRTAAIKSALKVGGIVALREQGGLAFIHHEEIAHIGRSRCIGEQECIATRSTRGGPDRCARVQANLYCAYEIVDRQGRTAAALVKTFRSEFNTPPELTRDDPEWRYETMTTERPDARTAREKLCALGYCDVSALVRWKPPPRGPDPHAEARRLCKGVLADVVGRGKVCLDPADPGSRVFRDCKDGFCGPEMVVLPTGRYLRGTSEAEIARLRRDFPDFSDLGKDERPEREVTIGHSIAVGSFEVTFEDWDGCSQQGGCRGLKPPGDEGWGRGRRPVINVSWNDITREYLPWLNARLGLSGADAYRLLSDGEWEFAARAGTTTRYAFGDAIARADARFLEGPLGAPPGSTAEAGSYRPNAFGLHDMHGNVAEWVADCYEFLSSPDELPTDGSAQTRSKWSSQDECPGRAHRGGSFLSGPQAVRSATRGSASPTTRQRTLGFRLARTLDPRP